MEVYLCLPRLPGLRKGKSQAPWSLTQAIKADMRGMFGHNAAERIQPIPKKVYRFPLTYRRKRSGRGILEDARGLEFDGKFLWWCVQSTGAWIETDDRESVEKALGLQVDTPVIRPLEKS